MQLFEVSKNKGPCPLFRGNQVWRSIEETTQNNPISTAFSIKLFSFSIPQYFLSILPKTRPLGDFSSYFENMAVPISL